MRYLAILAVVMLCGCEKCEWKCGKVVDKWREGTHVNYGVVAVTVDGDVLTGSVDDATYAKASKGSTTCICK